MLNSSSQKVYVFGEFRLDVINLMLYYDGQEISLPPKVIETLIVLIENRGEIISKDELMDRIWTDSVVEESNLSQYIYRLRKTLGKRADGKPLIETFRRRGYRFNGEVREIENEPQTNDTATANRNEPRYQIERQGNVLALAEWREEPTQKETVSRGDALNGLRKALAFEEGFEKSLATDAKAATDVLRIVSDEAPIQKNASGYGFIRQIGNHKIGFLIGVLIFSLAAAVFGYWFFGNKNTKQIESIAVLPFVNESGNADAEYLSDGITESLIGSLSQLPSLSVKARSSVFRYKGKEIDPKKIGQELSVQAVLLGRVMQRGEQLILNLELVDVKTENVIWSEQYARQNIDLVSLQREIVRDVSSKMQMRLSGAEQQKLAKNYTENSEAYRLYLKGRYYWYKFPAKAYEKSRDYYQQAIEADPNFALAYAGLAEYYGFGAANGFLPPTDENWSKLETAARQALALDNTLPDAYNALAGVKQFGNDRAGAERDLKRAIELNPKYAEGYTHYAHFLVESGRFEESAAQMRKAVELEPFNVLFSRQLGFVFYQARDFDRAIEQYRKTLELDSNDAATREYLGNAYEQKGMQKEAVAEWSRALTLAGNNELATMLERAFAASDFKASIRALWQKKLEQFKAQANRGEYIPAMSFAFAYTRLADKEQAFVWLAKAEQERSALIFDAGLDPVYDIWWDDSRFQDLLRRIDKMKS